MRLLIIALVIGMVGCSSTLERVPETKIVFVDKIIPYCPPPPNLPTEPFLVDELTKADVKNYGKVGYAYRHDMEYLRRIYKLHNKIIDQYRDVSQDFEDIAREIERMHHE